MQLRGGSRESGFKEPYKSIYMYLSIYLSIALHSIPGGCDLAVDRKCAFGAIKNQALRRLDWLIVHLELRSPLFLDTQ